MEENLKDSLGDTLGPFILKHEKQFPSVMEHVAKVQNIDERPLWKILKEADKCDVLSILEKEVSHFCNTRNVKVIIALGNSIITA